MRAAGWRANPRRVYYLLRIGWAVFNSMAFTLALVYQVQIAHLTPLELVLVGTVLELAIFLAEMPTGVVADLYSRRLSVLIGLVLIGAAIVVQGALPVVAWILAAQVVWGIGYTFTSGAIEAWITDEIGASRVQHVFTRGQQLALASMLAGTLAAGGLGVVSLRLPIVVAGAGYLVLAAVLMGTMTERNFTPARPVARESFRHACATLKAGLAHAGRRALVRSFLVISLLVGGSSEAFDRLWTARILDDFTLPHLLGLSGPAAWFTVFAMVGQLTGMLASLVVQRIGPASVNALHPAGLLGSLVVVQAAGVLGVALFGNLWLALLGLWSRVAAQAVAEPIESAWLNRNIDSASRATVLSVNSQFNAIGQAVGGPPLGALAGRTSIPVSLIVSAGILAPASVIYTRMGRLRARQPRPSDEGADGELQPS